MWNNWDRREEQVKWVHHQCRAGEGGVVLLKGVTLCGVLNLGESACHGAVCVCVCACGSHGGMSVWPVVTDVAGTTAAFVHS